MARYSSTGARCAVLAPVAACLLAFQSANAQEDARPDRTPDIQIVKLQHLVADELAQTLRRFLTEDLVAARQANVGHAAPVQATVVTAHSATNSLLLSGSPASMKRTLRLIAHLDVAPPGPLADDGHPSAQFESDRVKIEAPAHGGLTVRHLTKIAQRVTGQAYVFDAATVGSRSIPIVGTLNVPNESFADFLQTMLYVAGLRQVVRGDGDAEVIEIVAAGAATPVADDQIRFVPLDELRSTDRVSDAVVRTIVDLTNIDSRSAVAEVRPFLARGPDAVTVGALGAGLTVLIQGPTARVLDLARMLEHADAAAAESSQTTRVLVLEHIPANLVANTLNRLFGPGPGPQPGMSTAFMFRAVDVDQTSLIVTGAPETVAAALDITARLDSPRRAAGDTGR